MSTLLLNKNGNEVVNQKDIVFPLSVLFSSKEEMESNQSLVDDILITTFTHVLHSKINNPSLLEDLKVGDSLFNILIDKCDEYFSLNYSENWADITYPIILQTLIDKEEYEECSALQKLYDQYKSIK
jgi:hypothetical protein